jgi:hypothetical protein
VIIHQNIFGPPPHVDDPSVANVARVYDTLLGGSAGTSVDREHARQVEQLMPGSGECARANRRFAAAAVRVLVERGIRQFLDLGAGIPTAGGLHEIALRADPGVRWVALDNELVAVSYGELATQDNPRVQYVYGDFTDPAEVLRNPVVSATLNRSEPVAVLLCAALHFVGDESDPAGLVAMYRDATVRGSGLVVSHGTLEDPSLPQMAQVPGLYERANNQPTLRSKAEVLRLAQGYDLLEPGCVFTADWRPEGLRLVDNDQPPKSGAYCFVGIRR